MKNRFPRSRGIYLLPNLFTIASIFSGLISIAFTLKGNYEVAACAIFFSMVMDALDGKVARLTNTMTDFGAQFDSMADMVSFAVAPAVVAYSWGLANLGKFGWTVCFIYVTAVALRLARFNTQLNSGDKKHFQGLPCPSAAAIIVSLVWLFYEHELSGRFEYLILSSFMIVVAVLMVSGVRYRSFKDIELKQGVNFLMISLIALVFALIYVEPEKILFVAFCGYVFSGPAETVLGLRRNRRRLKNSSHKADNKSASSSDGPTTG